MDGVVVQRATMELPEIRVYTPGTTASPLSQQGCRVDVPRQQGARAGARRSAASSWSGSETQNGSVMTSSHKLRKGSSNCQSLDVLDNDDFTRRENKASEPSRSTTVDQ